MGILGVPMVSILFELFGQHHPLLAARPSCTLPVPCPTTLDPQSRQTLNLIKAGYEVVVYNRSQDKCAPAAEAGAKVWAQSFAHFCRFSADPGVRPVHT